MNVLVVAGDVTKYGTGNGTKHFNFFDEEKELFCLAVLLNDKV